MKHLIVKILINAAALMFTANLIDGIYVDGWGAVIIAAIILGIVNAIIRPLLVLRSAWTYSPRSSIMMYIAYWKFFSASP